MDDFIYDIRFNEDETEWRAAARRELAIHWFRKFGSTAGKISSLDVGCGTGMLVQQLNAFGAAYGVDVSLKAVQYSRRRGASDTVVGSADTLCFNSGSFDLVTMIEVLEHVDDDVKALLDIKRLMRPGGVLIITVPAFQALWSQRDVHLHHKRRYTAGELKDKMAQAGFRPLFCTYIDSFLFLPLWLLANLTRFKGNSSRLEIYAVSAPAPINALLLYICRLERAIYSRLRLPFGVSIACVARRP